MIIRRATAEDIGSLLDLNKQIGEFHFENAPTVFAAPSAKEKQFLLNAIDDKQRLFLVCESDGKIVGFLTAVVSKNDSIPFLAKSSICRVGTIVIDEKHRSGGLGRELMAACSDWAATHDAIEIRLEVMEFNSKAQGFYKKLGFHTQSRIMSQAVS